MNYIIEQSQYKRELSRNQYRDFIKYIDDNYEEMYGNKVSYTVRKDGDNFIVTLSQNSVIDFDDIFK
jgi:hypothetical protein